MVSVQTDPSSESGTAEGRITRRLFDEMAGYLFFAAGSRVGKMEQPYGCKSDQEMEIWNNSSGCKSTYPLNHHVEHNFSQTKHIRTAIPN